MDIALLLIGLALVGVGIIGLIALVYIIYGRELSCELPDDDGRARRR